MKQLANQTSMNSAEAYDAIFDERAKKLSDEHDIRRWKKLVKYFKGGQLIDLGCLDSLVPIYAKEMYPKSDIWGLDYSHAAIDAMAELRPDIIWIYGDVYNTELPSGKFDYVVLGEVLEHLDDPKRAVNEAFRILKKGGILAISTPLEEEKEPGAKDLDRHIWSINEQDLRDLVAPYADKIRVKVLGSIYFPKYKYNFPNILVWAYKK